MAESEQRYLLLLPSISSIASIQHLKTIYGPSLIALFSDLLLVVPKSTPVVDIALACPYLCGTQLVTRSELFDKTQADLSRLYTLICILLTKLNDEADKIDVRVVLLAYANGVENDRELSAKDRSVIGPVVNLFSLAHSGRQWHLIYSIESQDGEKLLDSFLCCDPGVRVKRVRTSNLELPERPYIQPSIPCSKRHTSVAVGGTFDHLHIGHKLLLTMTAFLLDYPEKDTPDEECLITIGITGDDMLKNKKFSSVLEPWQTRQFNVIDFLQSILCFQSPAGPHMKSKEISSEIQHGREVHVRLFPTLTLRCVELKDPFGPTIHDKSISALVTSAETESGVHTINSQRIRKGWRPLDSYQVRLVELSQQAHDGSDNLREENSGFQGKISSTDIRRRIVEQEAQNSHNPKK